MKYLEDPKGIFGGDETIETVARLGLAEYAGSICATGEILWTDAEIGAVMAMNMEGGDPAENARIWVDENQALCNGGCPMKNWPLRKGRCDHSLRGMGMHRQLMW